MYKNYIFNYNYNLEVYMHPRFCMHEHFHLINNPFRYKCETSQVFLHAFKKLMVNAKCNS